MPLTQRRGQERRQERTTRQQRQERNCTYGDNTQGHLLIQGPTKVQALYKDSPGTTPMTAVFWTGFQDPAALPRPARICRQSQQVNLDSLRLTLYRSLRLSFAPPSHQHAVLLWVPINAGGRSLLPPCQWLPIAWLRHGRTRHLESQVDHN